MSHQVITDLFATIVSATSAAWGETVHYHHGHMLEITNIVKQISADPDVTKRYPLIAVRHDIKQKRVPYRGTEIDLTAYIVTLSRPEYIAEQRIDTIFKPILTPIKDEFISQIARSGYFEQQSVEEVEATLTWYDRLFWGSSSVMGNKANIFGDWVDCIELEFSGLVALDGCNLTFTDHAPRLVSAITGTSGNYIYLTFSEDMTIPYNIENYFSFGYDGEQFQVDSIVYGGDNKTLILLSEIDQTPFQPGVYMTISTLDNLIESTSGIPVKPISLYPVVNNVQLQE